MGPFRSPACAGLYVNARIAVTEIRLTPAYAGTNSVIALYDRRKRNHTVGHPRTWRGAPSYGNLHMGHPLI